MASQNASFFGIAGKQAQLYRSEIDRLHSLAKTFSSDDGPPQSFEEEVNQLGNDMLAMIDRLPVIQYAHWRDPQFGYLGPSRDSVTAGTDDNKHSVFALNSSLWYYLPEELAAIKNACSRRMKGYRSGKSTPWLVALTRLVAEETFRWRKDTVVFVVIKCAGRTRDDLEILGCE